jgi:hypothetical protein
MTSKRKRSKTKRTRSKRAIAKRAKKAPRGKQAAKAKSSKDALRRKRFKKKTSTKASGARNRKALIADAQGPPRRRQVSISGRQSGDLQGLSQAEQADSESVDELVEEGNILEAGAVAGVEEADNEDEREVHTHEVPEDDVPDEYLDKD